MGRIAICAFGGWNDAGEAATAAVQHLRDLWGDELLAEVPAEDFVDLQVHRPQVIISDAGYREIIWPDTAVRLATPPDGQELVLVYGPEPSVHWRSYCARLVSLFHRHDVTTVLVLGALLADVPHTRPLRVTRRSGSAADHPVDPKQDHYEGPIGIPAVLVEAATDADLDTVSLWVQVPHYVAQNPSPKAQLALLRAIEKEIRRTIPLAEVEEDAAAWERGVDELARTDPDVADYVARLERSQDAADLPEASGDAIAREFEQFLRRRRDE
ncbi:PAC2 family protein [Brachybacterium sp. EF45031]|uniref:PAC2 family protein n=1 Tax=Brachybacterium sillae TaxID=2810536 RepID=UPI00217CE8C6|nr:PAC2 family protein [Brachybacterium sillae]MCS6710682.1 PAC2 family protein [Brachybacterium sillae]